MTTRGSVDPVPLRKFTIALAVSYDWCNAPPANGDADDALEQVTIIFNSVKGKYRRDFGIDLELLWVPFCEPEHEHYYTDGTGLCDAVHDQNQALLDATGEDYDVGHVFVSAQGSYQYGCVSGRACNATTQAMGASRFITSNAQAGIWLLSHELGHQFNAQHTFNVECDFGGNGNRIEPGSGATLMSYWGFCTSNGEHDVAGPVYPYFHAMSIREVDLFTDGDGDCWEPVDIGNHAPVVTDEFDGTSSECAGGGHGGEDVKCLPPETPFRLKGTSQDQDGGGTSPTFIWEQFNSGTDDTPLGVDPGSGPLFRSYRPMADRHTRVFPPLDHVLNGTLPKGEVLPIVTDRRLFFRLTARDPDGATGYDNRMLYVADGPPLEVTSPSGTITGGMNTVTWEASAVEATGADTVDILFSSSEPEDLDDFVVLLGDVPNDGGTATVEIPNEVSDEARIMVAPVNEVFFAVSDPLTVELLPVCPATDFCSQGCATANCRSRAIGGSQCTDDDELQVCDEGETIYRTTCDCVDPGAVPLGGGNVIPTLGCDGGTGTWWSCQ
ncbi:MAG: hypothetical protein GY716_04775 [bacterium]|nr:hypothetical protein [bacterium]